MSNITKYRVHEVAKDFGLPSKKVAEIMADYFEAPKNHMQALTDEELNLIFDKITVTHQVESIEVIFAQAVPSAPPKETPAAEQKPVQETPAVQEPVAAPSVQPGKPSGTPAAPQAQKPAAPAAEKPAAATPVPGAPVAPPASTRGRTTRVIDTRGVAAVDLGKYDEKLERLASERTSQMTTGKEKIKRTPDKKPGPGGFSQKRRQEEQERMRKLQLEALKKQPIKVSIPDELSVGELAIMLKKTGAEVVKRLMKLGVMASLSQIIDFDTASLVALEFGAKVERQVVVTIEERLIDDSVDTEENLIPRDPVVVVMGHVDHGKTSLLDYIRHSAVAAGEHGGITQHIGAYRLPVNGKHIAFLDTPGHEAFTSMRMRGASMTDIAILVVASDDGIKPQTVEAISHAKSAGIPIIVAINKMDKPEANPERIMQQLTEHELLPEAWGGDTIVCQVSAKTGQGVDNLMEMVLLTAEMQGLKANPNRTAKGAVVEAKLDKGRGPVATVLVQNGTLKQGDILIAGMTVGRVRAMADERGKRLETAGPSVPVEIVGLSEVPQAGDQFHAVSDERMARELVEQRKQQQKDEASRPALSKISLDDLFAQIQEGQIKDLNLIIKADVHGSVEALKASLEKLSNPEVRVRVIHSAVGAVTESDILLATTASAIIIGFNVRIDNRARESADRSGVDIRLYRVIYEAIEEMEAAMKGLLAPQYKEVTLGQAEVRQIFRASGIGTIAGCHVINGKIARNASVRLVRDGIVVMDGAIASLKRFKDDAREVLSGYECGISLEKFNDIKEGDIIEAYAMEEIAR